MSAARAQTIYNRINGDCPFYTRVEYIECLAALVAMFPDEVNKAIPGPNKPVYKLLWNAAAVDRVEWMFNNMRVRHTIPLCEYQLLSSGTASNEALHAEVNRWFKETQMMHQTTLKLKLYILTLGKLIAHNSAMYMPTTRQFPSSTVLSRAVCGSIWTNCSWRKHCSSLVKNGHVTKASLPLRDAWRHEAATVKQHIMKRPSSQGTLLKPKSKLQNSTAKRKRTAFTRHRLSGLVSQGSKKTR